jgi:hypothetical protein
MTRIERLLAPFLITVLGLAGASLLAHGCGSDDNPSPSDTGIITGLGDGGVDVPVMQPDALPDVGGGGDVAATPQPDAAVGFPGCINTNTPQGAQFLNRCSASACYPFNNAARLPLYNGGNLPPLP